MLLLSCVKDVDFNQAEDFQATPVYTANLVFFELTAQEMAQAPQPINVTDNTSFRVLTEEGFIQDNTIRAQLFLEFTNTIGQPFSIQVTLLDDNDQVTDTFQINIPASSGAEVVRNTTRDYQGQNLDAFLQTTQIVINFQGNVTAQDTGTLQLKSSGTLYMLFE